MPPRGDLPGADLVWTKLWPLATRAGLVHRATLESLLQVSVQGKLCLLAAPAGFGKTTLLIQWRAATAGSRVAWVSLDESDNDPTRCKENPGWVEPMQRVGG
jgi:LuxR family transcriptional regulator, maltose regulon positive regulatory protein